MSNYEVIRKFSELYYDIILGFIETKLNADERIYHKISFMEDDFIFSSSENYVVMYGSTYHIDIDSTNQTCGIDNIGIETDCYISLQFLSDVKNESQIELSLRYGRYENMIPVDYINFLIEKESVIIPRLKEIFEKYKK